MIEKNITDQIYLTTVTSLYTKAIIYVTYKSNLLQNFQPIGPFNSGKVYSRKREDKEAIIKGSLHFHGRLITEPDEEASITKNAK